MSLDECAKGLGTDKKFFVKSRFAVCDGASFVQTWFRNNRPVGESMFNVRVIGTVARNSRTINYAYHFSDFLKTGSNAADGLSITTKGSTPAELAFQRALHPWWRPADGGENLCSAEDAGHLQADGSRKAGSGHGIG